ncbi:MAG TPA: hypothetical protein VHT92_03645 [Candidatus Cybelea sp.]|jgi:sugar lactone lactonase YvrE|nr:hypothetical protein [Candidatus Cybelea sp.]
MRFSSYAALTIVFPLLAACSNAMPAQSVMPQTGSAVPTHVAPERSPSGSLTELFNLDYSNGAITVFTIANGKATATTTFTPGHGHAQGLASDAQGRIYTTVTKPKAQKCKACVEVFTDTGTPIDRLEAPVLKGASGAPDLTDVSVDAAGNVYVSDYGQQAVYFFPHGKRTKHGPTVVVQNSSNAASVLATPNGQTVFISGGCGFASVAPFTRVGRGKYTQGSCFGIGTIALIGGADDNQEDIITPVDGAPGLVSVSSPNGGSSFTVPDRLGSISGVALNGDASIAYVADAHKEVVYAFARPANGWTSGKQPKLLATYKGFKDLDIIAIPE